MVKDRATEMLEGVEEECKRIAKSEEEYQKCLQEKLNKLLSTKEAQQLAKEALEEE